MNSRPDPNSLGGFLLLGWESFNVYLWLSTILFSKSYEEINKANMSQFIVGLLLSGPFIEFAGATAVVGSVFVWFIGLG